MDVELDKIIWVVLGMLLLIIVVMICKKMNGDNKNNTTDINKDKPVFEPAKLARTLITSNTRPAKDVFIENIDQFDDLWDALSKGKLIPRNINDIVVDLNNVELIDYWKKFSNNPNALKRILAMWGVKSESCIAFRAMDAHLNLYMLEDGKPIDIGMKYSVISPYWVLTTTNKENRSVKTLIRKGIVKLVCL